MTTPWHPDYPVMVWLPPWRPDYPVMLWLTKSSLDYPRDVLTTHMTSWPPPWCPDYPRNVLTTPVMYWLPCDVLTTPVTSSLSPWCPHYPRDVLTTHVMSSVPFDVLTTHVLTCFDACQLFCQTEVVWMRWETNQHWNTYSVSSQSCLGQNKVIHNTVRHFTTLTNWSVRTMWNNKGFLSSTPQIGVTIYYKIYIFV